MLENFEHCVLFLFFACRPVKPKVVVCGFWQEVMPVSHAHHTILHNRSKMADAIEIDHDNSCCMLRNLALYRGPYRPFPHHYFEKQWSGGREGVHCTFFEIIIAEGVV